MTDEEYSRLIRQKVSDFAAMSPGNRNIVYENALRLIDIQIDLIAQTRKPVTITPADVEWVRELIEAAQNCINHEIVTYEGRSCHVLGIEENDNLVQALSAIPEVFK